MFLLVINYFNPHDSWRRDPVLFEKLSIFTSLFIYVTSAITTSISSGDAPLEKLGTLINKENGAVLSKDESGNYHIVTKYDVLQALAWLTIYSQISRLSRIP